MVEEIKRTLADRSVLAIYDPKLETEVHTDKSAICLGAILFQTHESGKRIVAYSIPHKTIPEEQKYHSYDLEILTVFTALKVFRVYLLGIRFKVVTECNAIRATALGHSAPHSPLVGLFTRL